MRLILALLIVLGSPLRADPPEDAVAISAEQALACAAARYRGEALRIRDDDDGLVMELRWLTPARNVLEIEVTGPGCRFLEVKGVGQSEARILPGAAP